MRPAVLVIGSGGREHALAWKLSCSPRRPRVIVAPGNDGMDPAWDRWELKLDGGQDEFDRLAAQAVSEGVGLVVVGPDNALADGIVDRLERAGLRVFGPTQAAARLESSKAFAKDVMRAAGVPTARFVAVGSAEDARKFLRSAPWNQGGWVIKADGLALGKGVEVCADLDSALRAADRLIAISGSLVIEERLAGEELSWLAFCDGDRCALMEPARDAKRLQDGDLGPNTGGMGAFSPVPGVPDAWYARVRDEVFLPTLRDLKARGTPFRGILYAGLMVDVKKDRIWVIEFNARFGDPETQVLLARMDADLWDWCEASARGDLSGLPERVPFSRSAAVVVVGAAPGYPDSPEKGIAIPASLEGSSGGGASVPACFIAGAKRSREGNWVTAGGRVLGAMGIASTLAEARAEAYRNLEGVRFAGMQARTDIALIGAGCEGSRETSTVAPPTVLTTADSTDRGSR